jgi:threonine dehydratase
MVRVQYWKSFVSGMGSPAVFEKMWPLAQGLLAGAVVVRLEEIARVMRMLLEHHGLLVEPAGAVSLAAALSGRIPGKRLVCVISGGNIQREKAHRIIQKYHS